MVRYGIIGFGLHAVRRLMPGFALATKSRVQALSRRDIDKARESARHYDIPLAFDSVEELCNSPEVDAVFVATPNSLHLEDVLTAIKCRKPVLCEKPMAMNADQCRQMVEAARKANVRLGIAHVFRFEDSTARLRERLALGQIGKPIFARSEFSFPAAGGHPRTWLNDAAIAGGGPIADVGVHCIDTLRYVLQDEVVRVTARGARDSKSGTVESAAVLGLEFTRGTLGSVMVSFRADYRTPFEIVGDAGVLRADDALNVERPIAIQLRRGVEIVEEETVTNYQAYARQVDAFANAVEGKGEFSVPGEEGWQNQVILDAAYRSMATGKVEEVIKVK
ncbi:MAG TPA: Gfo/Idh/MocA family oxidoreductase [Terriglobales bacterium]|jgi:1,5-anhydro-D-fructose reductase (1,5-anhydro-D-mannitol-forming)